MSEVERLNAEMRIWEPVFAKDAYAKRVSEIFPELDEKEHRHLTQLLVFQTFKKTQLEADEFHRRVSNIVGGDDKAPELDSMVGNVIAAFVGLGSDIIECDPTIVKWS
jgi:hypothetical protein